MESPGPPSPKCLRTDYSAVRHYDKTPGNKPTRFAHVARIGHDRAVGVGTTPTQPGDLTAMDDTLKRALRKAANIIAGGIRKAAEPISKRTAASVKVWQSDDGKTQITAGGESAPMARPFEEGIRHPVYATGPRNTWHWGSMPKREYMEAGAELAGKAAEEAFADEIMHWADDIGTARP